jgi:hypothetical protein
MRALHWDTLKHIALLCVDAISLFSDIQREAAMRLQKIAFAAIGAFLVIGICTPVNSQERSHSKMENPSSQVPGLVYRQLSVLGKRFSPSGKERTVYRGQFFNKSGNPSPARIIHQLPGLVRIEGFNGPNTLLSFNGSIAKGISARKENEELLEAIVMDSVEGMIESMRNGAAVRLLGRGIGPDPSMEPDFKGPRYDIYEVSAPVLCRQDKLVRMKLYYFDSDTGLLLSTRYLDQSVNPPVRIETRYSAWGEIEGSQFPARIEHYRGGELGFTFIVESIEGMESTDTAVNPK